MRDRIPHIHKHTKSEAKPQASHCGLRLPNLARLQQLDVDEGVDGHAAAALLDLRIGIALHEEATGSSQALQVHTAATTGEEAIHCRVELCAHCLPTLGKDSRPAAGQTRLRSRKTRCACPEQATTGVGHITHLSKQLTQLVLAAEQVAQHRVGLRDQPAARKERHKKTANQLAARRATAID